MYLNWSLMNISCSIQYAQSFFLEICFRVCFAFGFLEEFFFSIFIILRFFCLFLSQHHALACLHKPGFVPAFCCISSFCCSSFIRISYFLVLLLGLKTKTVINTVDFSSIFVSCSTQLSINFSVRKVFDANLDSRSTTCVYASETLF